MNILFRAIAVALCGAVATVSAVAAEECVYNPKRTKVLGGFDAKDGDYPFQVFIAVGNKPACGGTLIAPDTVLTAGHCVIDEFGQPFAKGDFFLRIGSINAYMGGEIYDPEKGTGITEVLVADGFDRTTLKNDLALLKLPKPSKVSPVRIEGFAGPLGTQVEGASGTVLGWGRVSNDESAALPSILRYASVPVIANKDCKFPVSVAGSMAKFGAIDKTRLCAGGAAGIDTCSGDSGGPLFVRDAKLGLVQVGLTSYGPDTCGTKDAPGVYTRIAAFAPFLAKNVKSLNPQTALVAENANSLTPSRPVLVAEAGSARSNATDRALTPASVWVEGRSRFPVNRIPGVTAAASNKIADYAWNAVTGDVTRKASRNALVAQGVGDIARLAGVIAKWREVETLEALKGTEALAVSVRNASDGDLGDTALKNGEAFSVAVRRPENPDLKYLTALSLAGDGTVDFFSPKNAAESGEIYDLDMTALKRKVACPFGIDHIIVLITDAPPFALRKELRAIAELNYPAASTAAKAIIRSLQGRSFAIAIKPVKTSP